jgi:hypothetical protein
MDKVEAAILLPDAEPARAVRCVGWLVYSRGDFVFDDLCDFLDEAVRDGKITVSPGYVFNDGDLNGCEVLISESPLLCFCLC